MTLPTIIWTTPDHMAAIAPRGADIELDASAGHYVLVMGGTEWRAPFEEVCS